MFHDSLATPSCLVDFGNLKPALNFFLSALRILRPEMKKTCDAHNRGRQSQARRSYRRIVTSIAN